MATMAALNTDGPAADNVDLLTKILTHHVVQDAAIMASSISDGRSVATVEGTEITFTVSDSNVQLGIDGMTAMTRTTDLETKNGAIHIIGAVLFGPTNIVERAQAPPSTETLASALPEDIASTLSGDGPSTCSGRPMMPSWPRWPQTMTARWAAISCRTASPISSSTTSSRARREPLTSRTADRRRHGVAPWRSVEQRMIDVTTCGAVH